MPDILLTTLNARYHHASFGLRYLLANMGELRERAALREFTVRQQSIDILEAILAENPKIAGFGVYIWNVEQTTRLVDELKRVRPEIIVVLGGPEVSYETEQQEIAQLADYVITGEGDLAFRDLCRKLLDGEHPGELTKTSSAEIIHAPLPTLEQLALPYDLYTDEDIAHRVIYVEASRGCPFTCEFCLSALEIPVRQFPLDAFLQAMQTLLDRGVRQFKFVDRTFNLNVRIGTTILEFFLNRYVPGLFLHFEMIPDRFPEALRSLVAQFPQGSLQFEVGIQTFNEEVAERISRRQDNAKVEANLRYLQQETGVHVHADLIVGLPGESVESFASGFDRLVGLGPQEIQVGILKRLRGTPIVRHNDEWQMVYSPRAPYEILENCLIDFAEMSRLRRFARYWDLIANSGNFVQTTPLIWGDGSPFEEFARLGDRLYETTSRTHGIPLVKLAELLFRYLTTQRALDEESTARAIWADYCRGGRHDRPRFLRRFDLPSPVRERSGNIIPARQARHVTT